MSKPSGSSTTLFDHVRELQFRLLACVSVLLVGGVAGYLFYNPIFQILRKPLHAPLFYSSPAGSFDFVMKICLLVAIAVALPVIIYNLIMFIRPAFIKQLSRVRVYLTTLGSILLSAVGASFAFIIILPASIKFFVGFQVKGLSALLDAMTYLTFVTNILICFILVFQIPLIVTFIDHIKPISPKKLLKFEKWVVIGAVVVGVLAPFSFDPTTELLIAAPIVVLFNMTIVIIALQHAYNRRVEAKLAKKTQRAAARVAKTIEKTAPPVQPPQRVITPLLPKEEYRKPSVLVNSFDVVRPEPIQIHKQAPNAQAIHIKTATAKPQSHQKWMDVAPTAVTQSIVRPAPHMQPVQQRDPSPKITPPAPRTVYERPRFISDVF